MNIKPCQTFIGYSASDVGGRVFTNRKRRKLIGQRGGTEEYIDPSYLKEISPTTNKKGYKCITIRFNGILISTTVHKLVMDAFQGPIPVGMEIRHLDNNPSNNNFSNLLYGTSLENAGDRKRAGTYTDGGNHHNAKLSNEQAEEVRVLRSQRIKVRELAERFNVSVATIESIIYGKSYKKQFKVLSTTGKPEFLDSKGGEK